MKPKMYKLRAVLILTLTSLLISSSLLAQKPKKTYDEKKFMKKVQFSFTPELIGKWMPDDAALEYVSEKSGKSLDELKVANSANLEGVKKSITEINSLGLIYVWDNIEVQIVQESPVKVANLLIHCHAKDKKFVINLTNCVQTNLSWYLGDGVVPEGDGFDGAVAVTESKKNKKVGGLLGKMSDLNQATKEMENDARNQILIKQIVRDSLNAMRPGYETNYESFQYDESKNNIPMYGYYILNDGTKVNNVIILNQAPEFFVGSKTNQFHLTICKNEINSPMTGPFNEDPNFREYINKRDIKAFYVNNYLYKKMGFYGWVVALNEGAIHSFISVEKIIFNDKVSYKTAKRTQKLEGEAYGTIFMPISEKDLLKMMEDAPEIVQAYKEGKYDLEFAEIEYNIWYDKNNPNKIDYIFGVDGR